MLITALPLVVLVVLPASVVVHSGVKGWQTSRLTGNVIDGSTLVVVTEVSLEVEVEVELEVEVVGVEVGGDVELVVELVVGVVLIVGILIELIEEVLVLVDVVGDEVVGDEVVGDEVAWADAELYAEASDAAACGPGA